MFGNHLIADSIAKRIYSVDVNLRWRFINGRGIYNEDAYTVLLAEHINLEFAGLLPYFVHAEQLQQGQARGQETYYGCDGMIIFQYNDTAKIGLFEAKWPIRPNWDYPQNEFPSHFTNQLERQNRFIDKYAIWEMFYDNRPYQFSWMPSNNGSTCTWCIETLYFQRQQIVGRNWTRTDLAKLLGIFGKDLYQIIYTILMCGQGKILKVVNKLIEVEHEDGNNERIPIPENTEGDISNNEIIKKYMEIKRLSFYAYFNIPEIK